MSWLYAMSQQKAKIIPEDKPKKVDNAVQECNAAERMINKDFER
jgi:Iap family predicted aminopeptidase